MGWDRALVVLAGLSGVLGIAASAAAAHTSGGANLETAGRYLLLHAAALVGVTALSGTGLIHPTIGRVAGTALVVGLVLFAGDLASRVLRGSPLAPMAAPTGGIVLMLGWALLALAALVRPS
jgi:uncharacterized membrane protein YgdD (TMEM256/DUF423 family)